MTAPRIVVVDDDHEMLDLFAEILEAGGHHVIGFTGSGTSIEDIAEARPDLLVLDALLPGGPEQLSGWDYLRLARAHHGLRHIPILVCSADVVLLRERREEIERQGAGTLEKPFRLDELERIVAQLLASDAVPTWDDETDLVLVADGEAHLVDASSAILRLLKLSLGELRRYSVSDIVAHGRRWTEREWARYLADRAWTGPVTLKAADATEVPARAEARIIEAARSTWHISRLQLA